MNKSDFIKIQILLFQRPGEESEKASHRLEVFANHISDKRFICRIHETRLRLNNK